MAGRGSANSRSVPDHSDPGFGIFGFPAAYVGAIHESPFFPLSYSLSSNAGCLIIRIPDLEYWISRPGRMLLFFV